MSDTIQISEHTDWAQLTLNRPDRLNSFNDEMHLTLRQAIADLRDNGARALLITGNGRGFCAGQDLGDRDPSKSDGPPDLGATIANFYNPLIRLIRSLELPVICAVNGVAAGAGANIAFACDIVLASKKAKFVQSFVNVGLIPDAGGSWTLPQLVGEARAKAMTMLGEPISAEQAEAWGLIWKAVEHDELISEAQHLASKLAARPTVGLGKTKQLIQSSRQRTLEEHLEREAEEQRVCGRTPDYAEGVSAFLEKRPPNFSGRLE